MSRLHRRYLASVAVIVVALVGASILGVAGLDALSLVTGAAVVAGAFVVIIGLWLEPADRARRAAQRRERKATHLAEQRAVRLRHVVHAAERRLFSQLEALAWLRDELELQRPLPPTRGAAAAPDALLELVRIIDDTRPAIIVELGSGVSTVVAAARLKAAGRGRVVALEHDAGYAETTRSELSVQGLGGWATVVDAPLRAVRVGNETYRWYEIGSEVPALIDVLFVDGPPGSVGALARYPALPLLRERLAPLATIFVDDGARADERQMVARWASEIEGLDVRELPLAKGAFRLTMPH